MNQIDSFRECVSALADGQLEGEELTQALARIGAHGELHAAWGTYHLVGEVLRSGKHLPCGDQGEFLARFRTRLASEPAVQAAALRPLASGAVPRRAEAANEPVFRWKLVAGAASLAAVAAISWNWIGAGTGMAGAQLAQSAAPTQLAQSAPSSSSPASATLAASAPVRAALPPGASRVVVSEAGAAQVMLRDPRLDALIEAHHQAAGASQMPSGFLRNATFESPAR